MHYLIKYILIGILILPSLSHAQKQKPINLTIKGRIVDADTKLPISGANLLLEPNNRNLVSDGHGYFNISNLPAGDYSLKVTSIGFEEKIRKIELSANESLTILLKHSDIVLHDVTIIGHQDKLKTTSSVHTIHKKELAETKGKGLAEILNNTAGVTMMQTGTSISKPVIHGMHSSRILLVNNGIKQEDQQWGSEHAPDIDPFIASTIRIIKGAESVRYGAEAIGGVIKIEPAPLPIHSKTSGSLDLVGASNGRTFTGSGMLEGSLHKIDGLSWRAQGTYKKSGNFKTADYYLNNTGLKESNFSGALTYRRQTSVFDLYFSHFNTTIGIFSGAHIGSLADLKAVIEHGRPFVEGAFGYQIDVPRQQVIHNLLKAKVHKDLDNGSQIDIQYGFQRNARQEYDIRRGERSDIPALNLLLDAHSLDVIYNKINARSWNTTLGINAQAIVNNSIPGTYSTPLIPNYDSYGLGVFLIERLVRSNYELEGGIRYDYKTLDAAGYNRDKEIYGGKNTYNNISGSLGGLWRISRELDFRSNIGLAWRPPTVSELYSNGLHHSAASIEIGKEDLDTEQGYKWINTFSLTKDAYQVEINAYGHFLKNYIYLNPTGEFDESLRGSFPIFHYEQTNALFYGLDVGSTFHLYKNLQYQLKGSLLRAKDDTNNQYLPFIPSDRVSNIFRVHSDVLGSSLENAFLQVGYETIFKQSRFEPEHEFAVPPNRYSLLSISAGTDFTVNGQSLSLQITADNALNTPHKEFMNRFRYYAHDKGRNVSFRISYKF